MTRCLAAIDGEPLTKYALDVSSSSLPALAAITALERRPVSIGERKDAAGFAARSVKYLK